MTASASRLKTAKRETGAGSKHHHPMQSARQYLNVLLLAFDALSNTLIDTVSESDMDSKTSFELF
jgi:hypothetical protein